MFLSGNENIQNESSWAKIKVSAGQVLSEGYGEESVVLPFSEPSRCLHSLAYGLIPLPSKPSI